jgi:hypothetical protein
MKHYRFVCIAVFLFTILSALSDARAQGYAPQGDLYVATLSGIYRVAQDGSRSIFATGTYVNGGTSEFSLAGDLAGNLFTAGRASASSFSGFMIYKYTPDGTKSIFASGLASGAQSFGGLISDRSGNLYAATYDGNTYSVVQFSATGVQTTFLQISSATGLSLVSFDGSGNLFVRDSSNTIFKYDAEGDQSVFATNVPAALGLAMDATGNLYAALGTSIFKYAPDGMESTFASGFYKINNIECDFFGNLYVGEGNSITQVTPDGTKTTIPSVVPYPSDMVFLVPEPSTWALLVAGCVGAFIAAGRLHRGKERPSRLSNIGLLTPSVLARKSQEAELETNR